MSNLDFAFSLFGIVLGLCLAEILTGFARFLRSRRDAILSDRSDVRLGLLTPMLAIFLLLDISTFWAVAWALRDTIPASYQVLVFSLFVTSLYYVAASWVFPQGEGRNIDLDAYYLQHKSVVFSLVFASNIVTYLGRAWAIGFIGMPEAGLYDYLLLALYYVLQLAGIFARSKRANVLILAALLFDYVESTFGLGIRLAHVLF